MLVFVIAVAAAAPVDADLDAVVLVRQGSATCAGVHVGDGRIATAYHCIAAGGRPSVTSRGGDRVVARIVAVDVAADLAVLRCSEAVGWPSLAVADAAPAVGTPVWALGHPFGEDPASGRLAGALRWSAADGGVAAVGERMLQVTAPLNPGNSGGPVVDGEGRVVGIASRRLSGAEDVGFAARSDALQALLAADPRSLSPLGGPLAVHALLASQSGGDGGLAVGARAELAIRDRVVVDAAGFVPLSPRWSAARFGASSAVIAEARAGLRQRIGRGPWAVRVDALGGIGAVRRLTSTPDDPFDLRATTEPAWTLAAGIQVRTAGFEIGWAPGISRATLILRWPGVFGVF